MNSIALPAISLVKGDTLDLWENLQQEYGCTLLGYHNRYWHKLKLYDANNQVWSVNEVFPTRKIYKIEKILNKIIWNPRIKVRLSFGASKSYELDGLKKEIGKLIDQDDDILTQFMEAKELKEQVNNSRSFFELYVALKKSITGEEVEL